MLKLRLRFEPSGIFASAVLCRPKHNLQTRNGFVYMLLILHRIRPPTSAPPFHSRERLCLMHLPFVFANIPVQPPKKDTKASAKQPQKTQKKKEGGGGGKAKKKKWSKGKVRDKLNNQVLFDKPTYEKLYKEVPQYKLITPSVVSERLKIRGSLARRALIELREKGELIHTRPSMPIALDIAILNDFVSRPAGLIKQVIQHHAQVIYTRTTKGDDATA